MLNNPRKRPLSSVGTLVALGATSALLTPALSQIKPAGPPRAAQGRRAATVAQGLRYPWGITWLHDGRPLITSKHGTLHILTNGHLQRAPIEGLPRVLPAVRAA
jgi:glucose/arabinose dehydrogenase